MDTQEISDSLVGKGHDDLQAISGVGPKWADMLHRIGIRRFEDLARYEPQDLAQTLLEQAGVKVAPERIQAEDWIGQARTLMQQSNATRTSPQEATEAMESPPQAPSKRKWEQHAAFSLFFDYEIDERGERVWQTRVYDNRSGVEDSLPGLEPSLWRDWILERAELPDLAKSVSAETEVTFPPVSRALYDAQVHILGVQVSEVWPTPKYPGKRLRVQVHFQVSGLEPARLVADRVSFRVEIHTVDLESGATLVVASKGEKLEPKVFEYRSQHQFPLPELGRYELHTIVLVLPPGGMMAAHRGPTLKVIP